MISPKSKPLNHAERQEMEAILKRVKGGAISSLSALDGFLAAIVCAPDLIMPSEYLPLIQEGETEDDDLSFKDLDEAERFFAFIMRHYNSVLSQLRDFGKMKNGKKVFYNPVLLEDDDGNLIAEEWAKGFLLGTHLRHEDWAQFTAFGSYDEGGSNPMLGVIVFAYENHPKIDKETIFREPVTKDMRRELVATAIMGIKQIYDIFTPQREAAMPRKYRVDAGTDVFVRDAPKTGRNDPCPCGSGKKFKKCCATLKIVQ